MIAPVGLNVSKRGVWMLQVTTYAKMKFIFYRLSTILKSFKTLYTLSPDKMNSFLSSYEIYDHDWANEEKLIRAMGVDYYNIMKKKIVDYYSVLNHLCAIGQVEKMYIPPAMDLSKSIIANQILFEEKMSRDLQIKSGHQVLDIGCGRGRIASHIASITGAKITGMNIDATQLDMARRFAYGNGLQEQCVFQQGDLNDIPFAFADNAFDAIYHVQVFTYARDFEKLFADLYRMIKPGGRLSCLDWVRLDAYDPTNAHHMELIKRVKPLIGAIRTPSIEEYTDGIKKAGFKIIINENASIDGLQSPLIEHADRFFQTIRKLINFFVRCRILPRHFQVLFKRLTQDGEAFVEADRLRLVTSSHYIVAEKE